MPERQPTDIYRRHGLVREKLDCHSCSKSFLATIDFSLSGEHEIECPHCHHIHYRKVVDGRVTEDRYSTDPRTGLPPDNRSMWKAETKPIATHSNSYNLLRELWMNRSDDQQ